MATKEEIGIIRNQGKFPKVIQPTSTSEILISRFIVDMDNENILVTYKIGDTVTGEFVATSQKEVGFYTSLGPADKNISDEFLNLFKAMKINISALVTALQPKV